jgi:hypothetical protein
MPFGPSVSTSLEPRAARICRRSRDIVSGMVRMRGIPLAAQTKARPMPVLPEVGSMIVVPSLITPRSMASRTME